jgi:hypothetical protein
MAEIQQDLKAILPNHFYWKRHPALIQMEPKLHVLFVIQKLHLVAVFAQTA